MGVPAHNTQAYFTVALSKKLKTVSSLAKEKKHWRFTSILVNDKRGKTLYNIVKGKEIKLSLNYCHLLTGHGLHHLSVMYSE